MLNATGSRRIVDVPHPSAVETWIARRRFSATERIRFYERLAGLAQDRAQTSVALERLFWSSSQGGAKPGLTRAVMLREVVDRLFEGQTLAGALQGWAPDAERMLIEAGERGDCLPKALEDAAKVTQAGREMTAAARSGVAYPMFLLATTVLVLWVFGQHVIPEFAKVLPTERWTGSAGILASLASFTDFWIWPSVAAAICGMVLLSWSMPRWTGRLRARLDRLPPFSIYRLLVGSRFLMAMAALLNASTPPAEALERMNAMAGPWLRERIEAALDAVRDGANLGTALELAGHGFPDPDLIEDLSIAAETAGFTIAVQRMADRWVVEGVKRIKAAAQIGFQLGLLAMAAVIGGIAAGVMAISQQASQALQAGM